jgi:hypothetical protein
MNYVTTLKADNPPGYVGDVRGPFFQQKFTLEDAIGSHACSLEALTGV